MTAALSELIQRGLECHRQGRLDAAKVIYDQVLGVNPRHPDGLHLSGLIALQSGDTGLAIERLRQAAQAQPKNWQFRGNLANALVAAGLIEEAGATYQRAARLKPDEPQFALGAANCLAMRRRFREAEAQFRSLTARYPKLALAWFNLANVVKDQNRVTESIALYQRAIDIDPAQIEAYINLGGVLLTLGKRDDAESIYRKALALYPQDPRLHCNLASALIERGQFADAEIACRRAIAIDSALVTAYSFLGAAISHQGRLEEALASHRHAAMLGPDNVRAQSGYGAALAEAGRITEALPVLQRAIDLAPERWEARLSLGTAQLTLGHFSEGWVGYAHRVASMNLKTLYPGIALAQNIPAELSAKHVVVLNEQGLGDQLFFLRFAGTLKQRGARITCRSTAKIAGILGRVPIFDQVISDDVPIPHADLYVMAGELPRLTGHGAPHGEAPGLPPVPPPLGLTPLAENMTAVAAQLARLGPAPYLGLTWRGGTAPGNQEGGMMWSLFKQISLEQFAGALRPFAGTFIVLQRHPGADETARLAEYIGRPLHDMSALNEDLERMLALLALIDDYVGVSNTNMHLRAGVGKTARVLVPCPPEWRWMARGEQSPWFPGYGVYRQGYDGDWGKALTRLSNDLQTAFPPVDG